MATCELIDKQLELWKLGVDFTTKPLIVGGMAMEYYGLRKHGLDVDFIISFEDYETLAAKYPTYKKDSWGDLGIAVHDFELFRTIWKLDYAFLSTDAAEYDNYNVISIDRLLLMKVLAMNAGEKHRADVELIAKHFVQTNQRPEAVEYMNAHISSYLASKDGFIYNEQY